MTLQSAPAAHRRALALVAALVAAFAAVWAGPALAAHDRTLDVTPEAGTATAGSTTTLTATVSAAADATSGPIEIDFEIEGGPNDVSTPSNPAGSSHGVPDLTCSIPVGQTSCTANYSPVAANLSGDVVRAWIHHSGGNRAEEPDLSEAPNETLFPGSVAEGDRTDVVTNVVTGQSQANILDCDDEQPADTGGDDTATNPTTGADDTTHETYTCKVTFNGSGVPNVVVDAENVTNGVNDEDAGKTGDPDETCTTGVGGSCTITFPAATGTLSPGTATLCFWIDADNDAEVNDANPTDGGDCAEAFDAPEGDDSTDTTRVTWAARAVTTIDIPDDDEDRTRNYENSETSITLVLRAVDQFGGGINNVNIDFFVIGGPNTMSGLPLDCTTGSEGTCTVTYQGNGKNGTDVYCAWFDAGTPDVYSVNGASGDGGECDTEPAGIGANGGDALTDRGQAVWTGGQSVATQLEVTPETAPGGALSLGTPHGLIANVKDENGNPMAGQLVKFEITGAGDPDNGDSTNSADRQCTTGSNGSCELTGDPGTLGSSTTFTSDVQGTMLVRAWVDGTAIDTAEGPDAGGSPDEPSATPDVPGSLIEPDTTDVVNVRWGKIATVLTAALVNGNLGTYGFDPRFSGSLVDDTGAGVEDASVQVLFRRRGTGSFALVGSITTGENGAFTVTVSDPPAGGDYLFRYAPDAAEDRLGDDAPLVALYIRPGVIFNVTPTSLPRNRAATLSGAIIPAHPGKKVSLQVYQGQQGTWAHVRTVTLDSAGRYRFSYTRNGPGFLIFRIVYATQDADHVWNVSRNMKITWT